MEREKTSIEKIKELTTRLNQWRHEYYNLAAPTVSDDLYDCCYDELQRLEQETGFRLSNSPTQTVGYKIVDGLEKTVHTIPLLSLEKTKQMKDIRRFIGIHQVLIMHKLDGLTVKLEYNDGTLIRASTRGNGEEGEVVTHNARAIDGIPLNIPYRKRLVVSGEAYITKPTFERLREKLTDSTGEPYKNARNMAAGAVRCYDAAAVAGRGLVFSPFSVIEGLDEDPQTANSKFLKLMELKLLGFSTCAFFMQKLHSAEQELQDTITELQAMANEDGLPIDGIVITYNDIPYSRSCGRTGHHYRDGIALKFEDDLHETVLRNIEWQPSRSGELSPVAVFDTIEIDGCDVSRASLHNVSFIKEKELKPGCRVLVSKRNMIIPHIEENLDRGSFDMSVIPSRCPCCDGSTRIQTSHKDKKVTHTLRCDNADCASQRLRQFVHFVDEKAMDIDGLSEATLQKFISRGWLNKLTDIFLLNEYEAEIIGMDGFGEKSWGRLWEAIQRSKFTTFEQFVVAMDIPMIGRTASRELSRHFNSDLDAMADAANNGYDLTRLNAFGETLHRNIHNWFSKDENIKLWKELQTMTTIKTKDTTVTTKTTDNPFTGRTIVVTGKLEHFTRDTINAKIESLGAKAGSAVSAKTDYLIAGENAGSKLTKAQSLGIPVLSELEFLNMVGAA